MTLDELQQLAQRLHTKANASTGISASEDTNQAIGEQIDRIIADNGFELQDLLREQRTPEQVIQYITEQYNV